MKAKRKPADPGPCSLEIRIQHHDGHISTAGYGTPSLQLGEAIFEILTNHARRLCDSAQEIGLTQAYTLIEAPPETELKL
jgi:hypothetical protein